VRTKFFYTAVMILIFFGLVQLNFYSEKFPDNSIGLSKGVIVYDEYNPEKRETIIALHGSPGSKSDFETLAPKLEDYRVYALDMYGFGESEKNIDDYGIESQADVLAEFMEKKKIEEAVIIGYSWGGGVAISFAHKYPEKVRSLILLASMGIQEGEPTGSHTLEKLRSSLAYPFVVFYPGSFAGSIGWRKGFMRSFIDTDQRLIRGQLSEIKSPSLILHGNQDNVIPSWVAEEHSSLLENSELVFYSGGHGKILLGNTEEIAEKINSYLKLKSIN